MNLLLELIRSSYLGSLVLSGSGDVVWFSLFSLQHNIVLPASIIAIFASSAAFATNYFLGSLLSIKPSKMPIGADKYVQGKHSCEKYCIWIFLLQWVPFLPVFACFVGFFRPNFWLFMLCVVIGRSIYYGYYLWEYGVILS